MSGTEAVAGADEARRNARRIVDGGGHLGDDDRIGGGSCSEEGNESDGGDEFQEEVHVDCCGNVCLDRLGVVLVYRDIVGCCRRFEK